MTMEGKDFGKLIRSITANVNLYIGANIEEYGIKQGQFEYFLLIFSSPGINQLELSRLKNVGKASVTKALKILEEGGYIYRLQDDKDKRNVLCYISEKGEAIVDHLMHVKTKAEREIFKGFSEQDQHALFQYLKQIHENSVVLVKGIDLKEDEV